MNVVDKHLGIYASRYHWYCRIDFCTDELELIKSGGRYPMDKTWIGFWIIYWAYIIMVLRIINSGRNIGLILPQTLICSYIKDWIRNGMQWGKWSEIWMTCKWTITKRKQLLGYGNFLPHGDPTRYIVWIIEVWHKRFEWLKEIGTGVEDDFLAEILYGTTNYYIDFAEDAAMAKAKIQCQFSWGQLFQRLATTHPDERGRQGNTGML